MRPSVAESLAFLEPWLAGRRRILEVGCGAGDLAAALARPGREVLAIDRQLGDAPASRPGLAYRRLDVLELAEDGFDAIVLVAVLHHLTPLDRAVARLAGGLAPGGLLLVDDFDVAAPDARTAAWFYERVDPPAGADPLGRWREHHEHDGERLHDGATMQAAIPRAGLTMLAARCVPYLFRYRDDPAQLVLERQAIVDGTVVATGLQLVASS
jgi:2-polyprenyl-3-methyl-5-hydroxy-6-metoxy-1,4-benzoquinol methylase